MQFSTPLIQGRLLKRYKRFLADVELPDGEVVTAHCPNTGAMTGCAEPGWTAYLSPSNSPKRKLAYTWELVHTDADHWIGINTQNANRLVEEAISQQRIPALSDYQTIRREVKYGQENSRIDLLLSADGLPDCFIEVKSVTLLQQGIGFFPDAVTQRGQKHLRELMEMIDLGHRAILFFCVQHTGIQQVDAAAHIDPTYTQLLREAQDKGVEIMAWGCQISPEKIVLDQQLACDL